MSSLALPFDCVKLGACIPEKRHGGRALSRHQLWMHTYFHQFKLENILGACVKIEIVPSNIPTQLL